MVFSFIALSELVIGDRHPKALYRDLASRDYTTAIDENNGHGLNRMRESGEAHPFGHSESHLFRKPSSRCEAIQNGDGVRRSQERGTRSERVDLVGAVRENLEIVSGSHAAIHR